MSKPYQCYMELLVKLATTVLFLILGGSRWHMRMEILSS